MRDKTRTTFEKYAIPGRIAFFRHRVCCLRVTRSQRGFDRGFVRQSKHVYVRIHVKSEKKTINSLGLNEFASQTAYQLLQTLIQM